MTVSNTVECMRAVVGKKVIGVLVEAFPLGRRDLASGTKTFVFDDGTAFTFSTKGTFWTESKEDVKRAVENLKENVRRLQVEESGLLELAGEQS